MSDLTPELAGDVITACQAGIEEIAAALCRCLDGQFTLTVGEPSPYRAATDSPGEDGPGLAIGLKFGPFGLAALLPESSGLLPDWYTQPDPTGESKLSTLAQELSMLLVPETLMADTFSAARVETLGTALQRSKVADDAILVPLNLESGEKSGQLRLVWPLTEPDALLSEPARTDAQSSQTPTAEAPAINSVGPGSTGTEASQGGTQRVGDFSQLPGYSRSLLRIKVPVSVRLAAKKEVIKNIVELAPGTIIKFDKGCEQPLHLYVGEQEVAEGEAVKVGDHFGFRLSQMLMPKEHFHILHRPKAG
jgi:flagellar motor switch/type III secretory pathway protein FliN